jgi:outer membrane protein TolC
VSAQDAAKPRAKPLTFGQAEARFDKRSATLRGAGHANAAARETEAAVATLHRPIITASAQYLRYQKTLSVDLAGPRQMALDRSRQYLSDLPGTLPPSWQDIATDVADNVSQALPGLFAPIPQSLSYRYRDTVFRPTVQVLLPIYAGGAIAAIQGGARAGVSLAEAKADHERNTAHIKLIRVYFGQLAAQALAHAARQSRDALATVYRDARKLEAEGSIAHARTLQAKVARDTAERGLQQATFAAQTARDELADTLDFDAVRPTTPLFVQSHALAPVATFLQRRNDLPQLRQADAASEIAQSSVKLARSRYRPHVFAFGQYNLNRHSELPIEPDWIVGLGVRITLMSNIDRGHALAAARAKEQAAEETARGARKSATTIIRRAWDLAETARRSFLLLDSSIAAAKENLRVQRLSFDEGEATVATVLGAEAALASARSQRIAKAYQYELALAGLLTASGQLDQFDQYLRRADIRLSPQHAP